MMNDWFDICMIASLGSVAVVELVYLMKANDRIEKLERELRRATDPKLDHANQTRSSSLPCVPAPTEKKECQCANCFVISTGHKYNGILRCHITRKIIYPPERAGET